MPCYAPHNSNNARAEQKSDHHARDTKPIEAFDDVDAPADPWFRLCCCLRFCIADNELTGKFLRKSVEPKLESVGAGMEEGVHEDVGADRWFKVYRARYVVVSRARHFLWWGVG